jgi:hypothetical protein
MVEIVRIAPLRAANVFGALQFVLFGVFALLFAPFAAFMPVDPNLDPQQQETARTVLRWMLVAYPLVGGAFGWLFALIATGVYNLVSPRIGGLAVETRSTP